MLCNTAKPHLLLKLYADLQKFSFELKRRLVDEPALPDSTAQLESMVSSFVRCLPLSPTLFTFVLLYF